jgi:hypothetical protein
MEDPEVRIQERSLREGTKKQEVVDRKGKGRKPRKLYIKHVSTISKQDSVLLWNSENHNPTRAPGGWVFIHQFSIQHGFRMLSGE